MKEHQVNAGTHMIEKARELTEFCLRHGGKCFVAWPTKTLFEYCFFHLVDRTVFTVRDHGQVVACLFGWITSVTAIQEKHAKGQTPFCWQRSKDHEDGAFLAEVISLKKSDLGKLLRQVAARWPLWRTKRIFTYRSGQLVELPRELIRRMVQEGGRQKLRATELRAEPARLSLNSQPPNSQLNGSPDIALPQASLSTLNS